MEQGSSVVSYERTRVKAAPSVGLLRALRWIDRVSIGVLVLSAMWVLWDFRLSPGGGWNGMVSGSFFLLVAALVLWTTGILVLVRWLGWRERWKERVMGLWGFVGCVVIVGLTLFCLSSGVAFRAAFWVSCWGLERLGAEVRADPSRWTGRRDVGVWTIDRVEVEGSGVAFHVKESGGDNDQRLMWLPGGGLPAAGRYRSTSMGGEWWFQTDY